MRGLYFLLGLILLLSQPLAAQFTSTQDGDWHDGATWGNSSPGSEGVDYPGAGDDANVLNNVFIDAAGSNIANVANLYVGAGVTLTVETGGTLRYNATFTIEDDGLGGNGFLVVDGTLRANQGSSTVNDGTTTVALNGLYEHNLTTSAGNLILGAWGSSSECRVIGYTTNTAAPGNLGQTFQHFTWNTPNFVGGGATAFISLGGALTTVNGTLRVSHTGGSSRTFRLFDNTSSNTLAIGEDLIVEGSSRLVVSSSGTNNVVNVGDDFQFNMTAVSISTIASTGSATVNVSGDFSTTSSVASLTLNLNSTGTPGTGIINIAGNFSHGSNCIIARSATAGNSAQINFNGTTTQSYSSSGTYTNAINFRVLNNAILNLGTSAVTGSGSFTLDAGGTIQVGSGDGLNTGTTLGNVRVSGTHSYAANSTIVYNGSGPQNMGTEWSSTGALNGVGVNFVLNKSASETVTNNNSGSTSLVGDMTLTSGRFAIGGSNTLAIQSDFTSSGGTITGTNTSSLTFSGSGAFTGNLTFTSGSTILQNLTIDRAGTIVLGSDLTIHTTGALAFPSTGNLQFDGRTLTINGNLTQAGSGGLVSLASSNSNLTIGGSGALSALPFCSTCGTILLNNVAFNRTGGASYTWNTAAVVVGTLSLTSGTLVHSSGLTMDDNSTFALTGGASITTNAPTTSAGERYNLSYSGTVNPTGLELPTVASDRLNNLNVAGNVTLDKAILVVGNLTVTSGSLTGSGSGITVAGASFSITGTYTSTGTTTFSRSGTTTMGGTPTNVQFGNITINNGATVSAANTLNVTGSWTNNGTFTANSSTVVFNGSGAQSINAASSPFFNLTIAGSNTKTLTGPLDVNGTLTINTGGTLSAGGGNQPILIAGTWDNQGTFTPTAGTVTFDGTNQTIDPNGQPFFNLTLATSTAVKTLASALDVNGTLTINTGVTLDVSASDYPVNLAGNWTNNGTFDRRDGTVFFDGSSTQNIQGSTSTTFTNINVSNSAGPPAIRVETNANLAGVLTLGTNSQFDADGAGNNRVFTLLSSADAPTVDAAIAQLPSGAAVTGPVTVQRYMSIEGANNNRIYRYISSPVQSAPVSQIQSTIPITGSFTGTSSCSGCGSAQSMFLYSEPVITDINGSGQANADDGYLDFPSAANTETLASGRGYAVFVRGNVAPVSTAGNALWSVRGTINSGTIDFTSGSGGSVTFTSSGTLANDGWNLVGNPFPSTIDWDAASGWSRTNINNAIYMRDNGLTTPVYATYIGGVGVNGGDNLIPIGQAFFVKSDGGAITFTADERVKVAGSQSTFFKEGSIDNVLRIAMKQFDVTDETAIRFHENATAGFDPEFDADKLDNATFNLFSRAADSRRLAVNTQAQLGCSAVVNLDLSNAAAGTYELIFSNFDSFAPGIQFTLTDNFLHTTADVFEEEVYAFEVTSDPASFTERFVVTFSNKAVETDLALTADPVCHGASGTIVLAESQAGVHYQLLTGTQSVGDPQLGTGGELIFDVPSASLTAGDNIFTLKGNFPFCDQVFVGEPVHLKSEVVVDPQALASDVVCETGSATLKVSGAPEGGSYRWYTSETGTEFIPNQFGDTYVTPELTESRTYFVSVMNSAGCEGKHVPVTATVQDVVPVVITADVLKLTSSYESGNQWYLNGVKIDGATGKTYEPEESGVYKVVASSGACTTSAEIEFAVTAVGESAPDARYRIFPVPTSGSLHIEVSTSNPVRIHLNNPIGRKVLTQGLQNEGGKQTGTIDLTDYASGVYILSIEDGDEIYRRKIVRE